MNRVKRTSAVLLLSAISLASAAGSIQPITIDVNEMLEDLLVYPKEWQNRYARIGGPPDACYPCVGFRCARDVPTPERRED